MAGIIKEKLLAFVEGSEVHSLLRQRDTVVPDTKDGYRQGEQFMKLFLREHPELITNEKMDEVDEYRKLKDKDWNAEAEMKPKQDPGKSR